MNVNNSIIAHGVGRLEERAAANPKALRHTPFVLPHWDEEIKEPAHVFDGREGGLGLLMKMLDKNLGLRATANSQEVKSVEQLTRSKTAIFDRRA